jgi:predicted ATPase/class 3 adenylate cyclase
MAELPSGTVTFLFSDIEGSTRLLTHLGDRYVEVLAEHHRALRAAFGEYDGREIRTEGDAFFVVFVRARDAIAAAAAAQLALASSPWPGGTEVRVRMGLHTGEPAVQLDDYVGLDVHRAARICAAAHGGQVLVSSVTRELVGGDLPPAVTLRDLGEHRLKDLERPEHLFQLVVGDLPADFPTLRVSSPGPRATGALPSVPNRTIGREADVAVIADRLRAEDARLLTLTGSGGVGKTRLALEAARVVQADFADGARFISLAGVRRTNDVPAAIVQGLGTAMLTGETPEQAVTRYLSAKHLLLVLDNLEHVLSAGGFVSRLLSACPGLRVLATSREPLALAVEKCLPVAPLGLPPEEVSGDALARVPAVELFAERARARDPGFALAAGNAAAVAEICRRLDGLPLAIELAAAGCGLLSAGEIAEHLDAALTRLGRGPRDAPARQQTLRATIDWSHRLLDGDEQVCFARFAIFAGGATVEAAEEITATGIETLARLVTKNLLVPLRGQRASTRVVMLETIRAYAAERLAAAPDRDAVHERHYRYFLALAQEHGSEEALWSPQGNDHVARLDAEINNLHVALAWAVDRPNAEPALAMTAALGRYWQMRGRNADAVAWIDRALSRPDADAYPTLCVLALCTKAMSLWPLGRGAEQPVALTKAEAIARQLGDPVLVAHTLNTRVNREAPIGRLDVAETLADEALQYASAADDKWQMALAWRAKVLAASTVTELRERVDRAASLLHEVGNVYRLADVLASAAYVALCLGSDRDAKEFVDRAAPIARQLDNPSMWMFVCGNYGLATLMTGDADEARYAFRDELMLSRDLVARPFAYEGLIGLAAVCVTEGDDARAARLVGAAEQHRYDHVNDPLDGRLGRGFFNVARARHGAEAWDAEAAEGGTLSFDEAIAYAVDEPVE